MTKQEEIREKQDKILNLVKAWAVIPHPYESQDAEGLLYMLSKEEGVVIKVDRELPIVVEGDLTIVGKELLTKEFNELLYKVGYVAVEPLI